MQDTISAVGICLGGRAKLRPLARTDVWGCVSTLEDRLTTHWSEGVGWDIFLLSSSASNLHFYLYLAVYVSDWLWLRRNCSRTWKCLAAGQTLPGVSERINHAQAGGSYGSSPGCVQLRT